MTLPPLEDIAPVLVRPSAPATPSHRSSPPRPGSATPATPAASHVPARDLDYETRELLAVFAERENEHNWSKHQGALQRCRAVLRGNMGRECDVGHGQEYVRAVVGCAVKALASPRSALTSTAAVLASDLAQLLRPHPQLLHPDPHHPPPLEALLGALVPLVRKKAAVVCASGVAAIDGVLKSHACTLASLKLLSALVLLDKDPNARQHGMSFIVIVLKGGPSAPGARQAGVNGNMLDKMGGISIVERCVKKGVEDANPGVREKGRDAFELLKTGWPEKAESLYNSLDPTTQKALSKYLGAAKPAPRSAIPRVTMSHRPNSSMSIHGTAAPAADGPHSSLPTPSGQKRERLTPVPPVLPPVPMELLPSESHTAEPVTEPMPVEEPLSEHQQLLNGLDAVEDALKVGEQPNAHVRPKDGLLLASRLPALLMQEAEAKDDGGITRRILTGHPGLLGALLSNGWTDSDILRGALVPGVMRMLVATPVVPLSRMDVALFEALHARLLHSGEDGVVPGLELLEEALRLRSTTPRSRRSAGHEALTGQLVALIGALVEEGVGEAAKFFAQGNKVRGFLNSLVAVHHGGVSAGPRRRSSASTVRGGAGGEDEERIRATVRGVLERIRGWNRDAFETAWIGFDHEITDSIGLADEADEAAEEQPEPIVNVKADGGAAFAEMYYPVVPTEMVMDDLDGATEIDEQEEVANLQDEDSSGLANMTFEAATVGDDESLILNTEPIPSMFADISMNESSLILQPASAPDSPQKTTPVGSPGDNNTTPMPAKSTAPLNGLGRAFSVPNGRPTGPSGLCGDPFAARRSVGGAGWMNTDGPNSPYLFVGPAAQRKAAAEVAMRMDEEKEEVEHQDADPILEDVEDVHGNAQAMDLGFDQVIDNVNGFVETGGDRVMGMRTSSGHLHEPRGGMVGNGAMETDETDFTTRMEKIESFLSAGTWADQDVADMQAAFNSASRSERNSKAGDLVDAILIAFKQEVKVSSSANSAVETLMAHGDVKVLFDILLSYVDPANLPKSAPWGETVPGSYPPTPTRLRPTTEASAVHCLVVIMDMQRESVWPDDWERKLIGVCCPILNQRDCVTYLRKVSTDLLVRISLSRAVEPRRFWDRTRAQLSAPMFKVLKCYAETERKKRNLPALGAEAML
ncbi:suppressor of tub2 mutation [Irineochytrium annulatum]|nr:suppressor of tub2 mutation [Irineochytrium annulatum]